MMQRLRTKRWLRPGRLALAVLATALGGWFCLLAIGSVPLGSRSYIRSSLDESIAGGIEYLYSSAHFRNTIAGRGTNPIEIWMAKRILALHPHEALSRVVEDTWRWFRADRGLIWLRPLPGEPPVHPSKAERIAIRNAVQHGAERRGPSLWNVWFVYAIHPELGELTTRHMSRFLGHDPRDWFGYNLTHRLMAYRIFMSTDCVASAARSIALRAKLAALQVTLEATVDLQLSDLYMERVALLLHAGEWSPAVPRWIERIIRDQETDGGWAMTRSLNIQCNWMSRFWALATLGRSLNQRSKTPKKCARLKCVCTTSICRSAASRAMRRSSSTGQR